MTSKRSRAAFETEYAGPPPHAPYALYGTPLPAFHPDVKDDGSYVPVWKQEVTDEHGRKRLHGAFTGGWSAGYFNTVGSKEGWTPATFVSSRSDKAAAKEGWREDGHVKVQRPEDFMDEEDLAAQAEAQQLETQGAFAGLGSGSVDAQGAREGMFADLFRTTGETMGIKLLRRMGWRQGQGIGAKMRRRAKGDERGSVHLFAPENPSMIAFDRKTDRKGVGFAGEGKLVPEPTETADGDEQIGGGEDARILRVNKRSVLHTKPKKAKTSAFGVGVLNDNGSDDEDPYAVGPQISYNRIIGADKKTKKKGGLLPGNPKHLSVIKPTFTPSKTLARRTAVGTGFRRCHDGRLPLDGFVLSLDSLTIQQEIEHPPPTIPLGWKSAKAPLKQGAEIRTTHLSTAEAAKASALDPKSRAALLGEQPLPGKSVFDFLSPAARDRLVDASGKTNLPPALGEGAPAGFEACENEKRRTLWDLVPELDEPTAVAALKRSLSGWMPYAEDEAKRARYRAFLELRAGQQSSLPERPRSFSIDQWAKELREFAQAAEVFRPISGLMASRFTTSSLSAPSLASDMPDASPAMEQRRREEDPAEKAARMGMFGPLTRERLPFHPPRLLCKRFNVRPPPNVMVDPGPAPDAAGGRGEAAGARSVNLRLDVVSQASLDQMMRETTFRPAAGVKQLEGEVVVEERTRHAQVDVGTNEALEGQRPGDDVFKAIFGSDDDDDD